MKFSRDPKELRKALVEKLKKDGVIRTGNVKDAMLSVPREAFLPDATIGEAYVDRPQSIGNGQTISAPHMVAIMAEELRLEEGMKVLEIGGGSGYHAAIVSRLVSPGGKVISIEVIPSLAERARNSLASSGIDNVRTICGDGSIGYPDEAPYDRIYYTCAAPFIPDVIFDQLAEGGILMSVEGEPYSTQKLINYQRTSDGTIEKRILTYCIFVPLVGKYGQRS
jgi:protein-L-isoaspartate(D-aspartate) O-methyltransferase